MKKFLTESKYLIFLWILCIVSLLMFLGHYSGWLIDFGREVYYPERILAGDVLYKDLFNIYGPLSYQINAFLYWIFGVKLSTLLGVGAFCSILIVTGVYLLAQNFLSKFLSFCIGFFTIVIGITTTCIFNFHFPYSWAILYGLIAFIYSLYFLIKDKLWLCAFLAGICITCKYDFLLYSFVILFVILKKKDWKALLNFFVAPILSFGILFAQGLEISDLLNTFSIIGAMAKTKTLTYFYQNSGIYFHPKALLTNLILFLKFAIPFGGILLGIHKNKKIITIFSFIVAVIFFDAKLMFGFLPILLLFAIIWFFLPINKNKCEKNILLMLSVLAVSLKVFWLLIIGSYGTYYVSLILIALLSLIPRKFDKVIGIYFILLSIFVFVINDLTGYYVKQPEKIVEYLSTNTKATDKVVIFPEGMMINFLAKRQSDGFYNSMLPLYVESFGEEKIIEHFNENKPEYIIFNNLNMKDYYFEYICKDYALNFCGFVQDNYELKDKIHDTGNSYIIFERRNNF